MTVAAYKLPEVRYDVVPMAGGLDLLTPTLKLPSGYVRDALNFEVSVTGGYTRISGYERYDGRPAPSDASFATMQLSAVANVAVGQTIVGPTGSAVVAGIFGTLIVYTKATGTFSVGQAITQGVLPVGTVAPSTAVIGARDAARYRALAADIYRADIQAVPGSGPIRGVLAFGGQVYAWRNNAGGTALLMYRATTSGWALQPLGFELTYTAGNALIAAGVTITGTTSGATGVVARQTIRSGSTTAANAVGTLVLSSRTGTFVAGESLTVSGLTRATAGGSATAITLLPNGRVQTAIGNFGGLYGTRAYGCDGVNPAFEFDGTAYVPIRTGMPVDAPGNVAVHANSLFLSFAASVQFSSIGEPYRWSPIFGAGEIAMQDAVTALQPVQGSDSSPALVIYTNDQTSILYGNSSADFRLVPYSPSSGANRYSAQRMETAYALDDRGVTMLSATQNYGNFDSATLTLNIRQFIQSRRTSCRASGLNREKSQYRVFYADGSALYMTIVNGKYIGAMPIQFSHSVEVWAEGERADGSEQSFFGSSDGFVYRMDSGPSFDGQDLNAYFTLTHNFIKSPRIRKRFRRASIEVSGPSFAEFRFGYDLAYGLPDNEQPTDVTYQNRQTISYWDSSVWDSGLTWDGKTLAPTEVEMNGTGENIAMRVASGTNFIEEFTINSVILQYSLRRGIR